MNKYGYMNKIYVNIYIYAYVWKTLCIDKDIFLVKKKEFPCFFFEYLLIKPLPIGSMVYLPTFTIKKNQPNVGTQKSPTCFNACNVDPNILFRFEWRWLRAWRCAHQVLSQTKAFFLRFFGGKKNREETNNFKCSKNGSQDFFRFHSKAI